MSSATLKDKKIVFVIGVGRSGTTWLQNILAQSTNVATAPETHLFDSYLRSLMDAQETFRGAKVGLTHIVDDRELEQWVVSFVNMCLQKISERRPDARIVLDKTPSHSRRIGDIIRVVPDCYFVHVVRDPRAVVVSLLAASKSWGARWAPGTIKGACSRWKQDLVLAQAACALTTRYREVRYEQLHANGPSEILRLFEWLGEPVEYTEAVDYVAASSYENMRNHLAAPLQAGNVEKRFFRRGEVDSWRRDLSGSDIAIIERLTRKQMALLGYKPEARLHHRICAAVRLSIFAGADKAARSARASADRLKP